MNVKNLISKKHRALSKKGLRFNSIAGHIGITDGIMALNDLYMKTPLFNAVGMGTINLEDETLDSIIGVEPLGKVTDLAEKIPLSGYLLNSKTRSFLTYYFDVKGPMSDPVVKDLSAKRLTKGSIDNLKKLFLFSTKKFKVRKSKEDEVPNK